MAARERDRSEPVRDVARSASSRSDVQKKAFRAAEQQREDVIERREAFEARIAGVDPDRLVFIDESGCNVAMTPRCAWAPEGERAEAFRPVNWGDNVTLIGAILKITPFGGQSDYAARAAG